MSIQIFVFILLALSLCSAAQHVSPTAWEILELLISDPGFLQPAISTQCCAVLRVQAAARLSSSSSLALFCSSSSMISSSWWKGKAGVRFSSMSV